MFGFRLSSNSLDMHCRILFLGAFIAQSEKSPSDGEVLHSLLSNKYNDVKMIIINTKV